MPGRPEAVQAGDQGEYRRRARHGPSADLLHPPGLRPFFVNLAVLLLDPCNIVHEYFVMTFLDAV